MLAAGSFYRTTSTYVYTTYSSYSRVIFPSVDFFYFLPTGARGRIDDDGWGAEHKKEKKEETKREFKLDQIQNAVHKKNTKEHSEFEEKKLKILLRTISNLKSLKSVTEKKRVKHLQT
jgi:hypothetical protein